MIYLSLSTYTVPGSTWCDSGVSFFNWVSGQIFFVWNYILRHRTSTSTASSHWYDYLLLVLTIYQIYKDSS